MDLLACGWSSPTTDAHAHAHAHTHTYTHATHTISTTIR